MPPEADSKGEYKTITPGHEYTAQVITGNPPKKSHKFLIAIVTVAAVFIGILVVIWLFRPKSTIVENNSPKPTPNKETLYIETSQGTVTSTSANFTSTTQSTTGVPTQSSVNDDVSSQIAAIETKAGNKAEAKDVTISSKVAVSSTGNTIIEQWDAAVKGKSAVYQVTIVVSAEGKQTYQVVKK